MEFMKDYINFEFIVKVLRKFNRLKLSYIKFIQNNSQKFAWFIILNKIKSERFFSKIKLIIKFV